MRLNSNHKKEHQLPIYKAPQENVDLAVRLYQQHGSSVTVGNIMGVSEATVRRYLERAGVKRDANFRPLATNDNRPSINPKFTQAEPPPFALPHAPPIGTIDGPKWELVSRPDNTYCFGAFGDLHCGSKYTRWDVRDDLVRTSEERGAQAIFDTGNWIDGEKNFNRYDLEVVGLDAQLKLLADKHPKTDIPIMAVTGADHEGWAVKDFGVDVGRYCESVMRDAGHDWTDLGYMQADVVLRNANTGATSILRVMHPGGGSGWATSYRPQKIIDVMEENERPDVLIAGHYHKLDAGLARNVWYAQTGCFDGRALVKTEGGYQRIKDIQVGDLVWTHRGRLRPVSSTRVLDYEGDAFEIVAGPTGAKKRCKITATAEHPFLTTEGWKPACRVMEGDYVAVESSRAADGSLIPHYRVQSEAERYSATPNRTPKTSRHNDELDKYVKSLPPHYRIITTHRVTPDAIAVDFEKNEIVAIEMERGRRCPANPRKYDLIPGVYDDVLWVCTGREGKRKQHDYKVIDGIVYAPVRKTNRVQWKRKVYNLSVVEDETYMCGRFYVHNCQQDQTPFMAQKAIQAHIGGVIIQMRQDPATGAITEFTPSIRRYFNKKHYFELGHANDRFSGSGPIRQVPRKVNAA